jgi:hypothetical protein
VSKLEVYVTCNDEQRLYIVDHGDHLTTLGYDVCAERTERILAELVGRLKVDEKWLDEMPDVDRGTPDAWNVYMTVLEMLKLACEDADEQAVYSQSPQLMGLEGWRVEVQDTPESATRRFIVGKSTGWAPCHLEILRSNADGGLPARHDYYMVTPIQRVR